MYAILKVAIGRKPIRRYPVGPAGIYDEIVKRLPGRRRGPPERRSTSMHRMGPAAIAIRPSITVEKRGGQWRVFARRELPADTSSGAGG